MSLLFVLLLSLPSPSSDVDGLKLYERARSSSSQLSYHKHIENIKNDILKMAWDVAEQGEYRINYCIGKNDGLKGFTRQQIREDVIKVLNKLPGLNAFGLYAEASYPCLNVDWNQ